MSVRRSAKNVNLNKRSVAVNKTKQLIAIAKALGWEFYESLGHGAFTHRDRSTAIIGQPPAGHKPKGPCVNAVPLYTERYGEIQEAIKALINTDELEEYFGNHIAEITIGERWHLSTLSSRMTQVAQATPAQLAEALLKTLNLWEDE